MACSKAHIKQTGGKLVLRLHKLAAVISAEPQDTSCRLHRWQQQRCATGNNKRKAASSTHWQNSSFLGNFLQGRCCRCCPNLLNTQGGTHDPADSQLTPPGTIKHPCITHWERWCLLSATAPHILIKQPHLGKDTCPPAWCTAPPHSSRCQLSCRRTACFAGLQEPCM